MEYRLQDSQPPHLFVIRKVNRKGPQSEDNLAFYYILDGAVYQAPTLHAAIAAKLVTPRENCEVQQLQCESMAHEPQPLHCIQVWHVAECI